jgi:enoyl-CoA hydratase
MNPGSVHVRAESGIATFTIDRPEKRNAMTAGMCAELRAGLERLRDDPTLRVGVIDAVGDTFCAGADLGAPPEQFWHAVPGVGIDVGKPVIVVVQGPVVGLGLTLVTYCDLCVAADTTSFLYPEARVGVSKGLIAGLAARVPHKVAMELMLLGGPVDAARALAAGLVNRVALAGEHRAVAQAMAAQLAGHAPLVMAQLKSLVDETLPRSPVERLYRTSAIVERVTSSEDAAEGLRAFREKRAPRFRGA